jgi:hypothetical protein
MKRLAAVLVIAGLFLAGCGDNKAKPAGAKTPDKTATQKTDEAKTK